MLNLTDLLELHKRVQELESTYYNYRFEESVWSEEYEKLKFQEQKNGHDLMMEVNKYKKKTAKAIMDKIGSDRFTIDKFKEIVLNEEKDTIDTRYYAQVILKVFGHDFRFGTTEIPSLDSPLMATPIDFLVEGKFNPFENATLKDLITQYRANPQEIKAELRRHIETDFREALVGKEKKKKVVTIKKDSNGNVIEKSKTDDSPVSIEEIETAIAEKDRQIDKLRKDIKTLSPLANKGLLKGVLARAIFRKRFEMQKLARQEIQKNKNNMEVLHSDVEKLLTLFEQKLKLVYLIVGEYNPRFTEQQYAEWVEKISIFVDSEMEYLDKLSQRDFVQEMSDEKNDSVEHQQNLFKYNNVVERLTEAKQKTQELTEGMDNIRSEFGNLSALYESVMNTNSPDCVFANVEFINELNSVDIKDLSPEDAEFVLFLKAEYEKFISQQGPTR